MVGLAQRTEVWQSSSGPSVTCVVIVQGAQFHNTENYQPFKDT